MGAAMGAVLLLLLWVLLLSFCCCYGCYGVTAAFAAAAYRLLPSSDQCNCIVEQQQQDTDEQQQDTDEEEQSKQVAASTLRFSVTVCVCQATAREHIEAEQAQHEGTKQAHPRLSSCTAQPKQLL